MDSRKNFSLNKWFRSRPGLVSLVFLTIAAFFVIAEHRAHLYGILPFALLLLCPLLHFFMPGHGGHHGHAGSQDHQGHDVQIHPDREK